MHCEQAPRYICPGDAYPISRAVHLARLAAFYPPCRSCQHRHDVGQLPKQTVERLEQTECRVERPSLFTSEGVRGVHRNELDRRTAGQMAGALASLLWEEMPYVGRCDPADDGPRASKRRGPSIVIGYDERPSSPDLLSGVAAALKRMGCHVVEIGLTTRPCFCFCVHHLQAAGGVFVTGAGCDPAWTGIDFVGRDGASFSRGDRLAELEARFVAGYSRPTRHAGTYRLFQATVPYVAGLWKHFHALRPLEVVVASSLRCVRSQLGNMAGKLPCRLDLMSLPVRARAFDASDDDVMRVGRRVREQQADLGVLIDDDGCRAAIVDEQGALVDDSQLLLLLADFLRAEQAQVSTVLAGEHADVLAGLLGRRKLRSQVVENSWCRLEQCLLQTESSLGYGGNGRFWFRESRPVCDAIVTLAHVLQALSCSDASCSEVLQLTGAVGESPRAPLM